MNKIGGFESFSYYEHNLPKKTDNPAYFKVSLSGPDGEIYLSCKVKKRKDGNWQLLETIQDSLVRKKAEK
ncbi:hypothetical protein ABZR88_01000 [Mucilaginibacter yixingensis]|uniref:hypothetical protein n=1 Tax=Mucilaginibacter yixingensis TaxID=1295612 RepID=UPI001473A8EE|nr:hypothetical protein [Mucilaginibacter yixingensis]